MSRVAFPPSEVVFRISTLFEVIVGERTSEAGFLIATPSEVIVGEVVVLERSEDNYWTTDVILE